MKGWELSRQFFEECIAPLIRKAYPGIESQMAAGVFGMGSDAAGLDDELSREHHWGPRCNILLGDSLQDLCAEVEAYLQNHLPREYLGFEVYHLKYNRSGVTVETIGQFFEDMVGFAEAPAEPADWFRMTEADLFAITSGQLFYDATGDFTRRRAGFAYYPDPIWRKKMADWMVYLTGHGVYNLNRVRQREDWPAAAIYQGVTVKRLLEMGHLLNRTYAPYNKWLYRSFKRLPQFSAEMAPILERALATEDWEEKLKDYLRIYVAINDALHRQGLTRRYYPPVGQPEVDEHWMYFLYDAAVELYRSIPKPLVWGRFNEVEKWEQVVKQVILSPDWKAGFATLKEEAESEADG